MKFLLISSDFPFGKSGDNNFVKNEIMFYRDSFSKITVLSTNSEKEVMQELPNNAVAIQRSLSAINPLALLKAGLSMFSTKTYQEFAYARKKLRVKNNLEIAKQIFKYYYAYFQLKDVIQDNSDEETVNFSYWLSSRAYALARLKLEGKIKGKVVSRCHGFDCFLSRGYLPFRREIDLAMDDIFFISENGLKDYTENIAKTFDTTHAKNNVSRLGILPITTKDHWIQSADGTINIVSCSFILSVKRLDLLIDALSTEDVIKINWIHFGDGSLLEEIKNYAEEKLKNKKNITYNFFGNIDNTKLKEYYSCNNIDLLVNSSDSEGIPVSIMEAYLYHIPAIGRDVGGMSEIISESLLVKNEKAAIGIIEKIRYYDALTTKEKEELRKKVNDVLVNKYNIENNVKEIIKEVSRWTMGQS